MCWVRCRRFWRRGQQMTFYGGICAVLSVCAFWGCPTSAATKETMTLAEKTSEGIAIVQIDCETRGTGQECTIAGTRIFRSAKRPLGANGDPKKVCFVEVGISDIPFTKEGGVYVSKEGPGGFCSTQIISTIDFANQSYTQRKFSDIRNGDICAAQADESHAYTISAFLAPLNDLRCDGIESIPSLWLP